MSGPGPSQFSSDLEAIRAAVTASNPGLYRHLALYLQVLRQVLPERVHQACFHLATQVHAPRYLRLSRRERLALHRRRHELVQRCCSLLTVEQLEVLARRMVRDEQQRRSDREQQLLSRLIRQTQAETSSAEAGDPEAGAADLPPGSVQLDLSRPLVGGSFPWSELFAPPSSRGSALEHGQPGEEESNRESSDPLRFSEFPDRDRSSRAWPEPDPGQPQSIPESGDLAAVDGADDEATQQVDEEDEQEPDPAEAEISAIVAAAAAAAGMGLGSGAGSGPTPSRLGESTGSEPHRFEADGHDAPIDAGASLEAEAFLQAAALAAAADLHSAAGGGPSDSTAVAQSELPDPWNRSGLPTDPVHLLTWLDGLEKALERRLRHLSHAINVDLLRFGLSRGLLPVNLLDAVLQGQIETMAAPANVLRLQLPFGLRPGAPPLQALAILMRQADLEMEEPRLRTCRRRLHQHRQELRRMAQQYRRLQRRQQAHEAERLWLQDIRRSLPPKP